MVTEILKNYIPEHAEALSEQQYAQLERYAELLVEWNEKMNLTAITDPVAENCQALGIPVDNAYTMAQLGHACRITVGASVVALLSDSVFPE